MGGCDKRTWAREAEESPLLEAAAREQLLKTLQAGEHLACGDLWSVEISDSALIMCSSKWCIQVINKFNLQTIPHIQSHA
jgi:hypothetical protein